MNTDKNFLVEGIIRKTIDAHFLLQHMKLIGISEDQFEYTLERLKKISEILHNLNEKDKIDFIESENLRGFENLTLNEFFLIPTLKIYNFKVENLDSKLTKIIFKNFTLVFDKDVFKKLILN